MSAVLRSPWQGFARQQAVVGATRQRQVAAHAEQSPALEARVWKIAPRTLRLALNIQQPRSPTVLPEFLESLPSSTLRQMPSTEALRSIPTVSGTLSAG